MTLSNLIQLLEKLFPTEPRMVFPFPVSLRLLVLIEHFSFIIASDISSLSNKTTEKTILFSSWGWG